MRCRVVRYTYRVQVNQQRVARDANENVAAWQNIVSHKVAEVLALEVQRGSRGQGWLACKKATDAFDARDP